MFWTAKQSDDFAGLTVIGDRRHAQHVRQEKLRVTMLRILLQKLIKNLTRLGRVFLEEILPFLSQALGPLAACSERRVECKVA